MICFRDEVIGAYFDPFVFGAGTMDFIFARKEQRVIFIFSLLFASLEQICTRKIVLFLTLFLRYVCAIFLRVLRKF